MAIIKRKDTKSKAWQARWSDLDGKNHTKHFNTKAEAVEYHAMKLTEVARGEFSDPQKSKTKLDVVYAHWFQTYVNMKPKTVASSVSIWKCMVAPTFGNRQLAKINRADVKIWVTERKSITGKTVSDSRIRQSFILLNQLMNHAIEMGLTNKNPLEKGYSGKTIGILKRTEQVKQRRVLSSEEFQFLLNNAGDYKALICLAGQIGLRWGEVIALTPEDIDLQNDLISINKTLSEVNGHFSVVPPKSGEARTIPLPALSKKFLVPLILATEAGKPIFRSPKGEFLRHSNFTKRTFKKILEASNLQSFTFHDLRHTAVSQMINAGMNIVTISKIVGHASPSFTLNVYSHLLPNSLDEAKLTLDNHSEIYGITATGI